MRHAVILRAAMAAALALFSASLANAEELVRIGLAVPHNASYVQFYAADTLGFYKEAGINTEITVYRGGAASQEALSAGAASDAARLAIPGAQRFADQVFEGPRRQEDRRRHQG